MLRVIPALLEVLLEARLAAGKSRADIASACGVGEKTVERWETHDNYPLREKGNDLAEVVEAYSALVDIPAPTLWRRAIDRAVADAKALPHLRAAEQEAAKLAGQAATGRQRGKAPARKPRTAPRPRGRRSGR